MRIFAAVVGTLLIVLGLFGGFSAAAVIGITDGDHSGNSWSCQVPSGGSSSDCSWDSDSNPNDNATGNAAGISVAIGATGLFVGGCALLAGVVASSVRRQPAANRPQQPPQPVGAGGPPSYGSGWPAQQQPPAGNDQPRS